MIVLENYSTKGKRVIYTNNSYYFLDMETSQFICIANQWTGFKNDSKPLRYQKRAFSYDTLHKISSEGLLQY